MASYLCMFSAPEEHIAFMEKHHGTSRDYYVGEPPRFETQKTNKPSLLSRMFGTKQEISVSEPVVIPDDWPTEHADVIDIEINHRNVDLYHAILNKTSKPVEGSGSIFQTWFAKSHSAIHLDNYNEDFAFRHDQLPELLAIVKTVTSESLQKSFHEWCVSKKKNHEPGMDEATEMYEEFVNFANYLEIAIAKKHGLVWVVS